MRRPTKACVALPFLLAVAASPIATQNTWIVDADAVPGTDFTDLPPAVAAASDGDLILVRGAFGNQFSSFSTDKGLTVVGLDGPSLASSPPVEVANLPAGSAFALVGFFIPEGRLLRVEVTACQGTVHLEQIVAAGEPGPFFPVGAASITIRDSDFVTMQDVETFGDPAVDVSSSSVLLVSCELGQEGGGALRAQQSVITVTEPRFRSRSIFHPILGGSSAPAVELDQCIFELAGTTAAYLQGPGDRPAIDASGSILTLDPAVQLNPFVPSATVVTENTLVTMRTVPATWVTGSRPGAMLTMTHKAEPGEMLFALLGLPQRPPLVSSIGTLLVDPTRMAGLPVTVPTSGLVEIDVAVPPGFPIGPAFVAQGARFGPGGIALTHGSMFVVH